jgi:single-stranded-DNA-specific exonuclease
MADLKKIWIQREELSVPSKLKKFVGGNDLIAQTLIRRGIQDVETASAFIDPNLYQPTSPYEMPGMKDAVERIERAINDHELICVWGDFDVDGQTATTVLYSTLLDLGAQLFYHIPVRERESHGVNIRVLDEILHPDKIMEDDPRWPRNNWEVPTLLITCDTGVSANEAVVYAMENGVDVIVTDHHELPEKLPPAIAIINSRLCLQGHPLEDLPGVGVVYKLSQALYQRYKRPKNEEQFLDLVALGIVADVANQKQDTRYLLQRGLEKLRSSPRLGISTMLNLAQVVPGNLTEEHIGFVLGPRLNALGRLSDANKAVELLTTGNEGKALSIAYQLESLNSQRKFLTNQVIWGALSQIEQNPQILDKEVLVLSHPDWEAGVIGIVAGKLAERFGKPTILISTSGGEMGHGSARSVEGINIIRAITACSDLLDGYGGHPMAAGLAIKVEQIDAFQVALCKEVANCGPPPKAVIQVDGVIPLSTLNMEFVKDIERLAPFGQGNPPLVFVTTGLRVKEKIPIGKGQEHLSIIVEDEEQVKRKVIWWGGGAFADEIPSGVVDLAYRVRSSTYKGQRDIQVEWVDCRPSSAEDAFSSRSGALEIFDYRDVQYPLKKLLQINEEANVCIWAEGKHIDELAKAELVACSRYDIEETQDLVVWTIPPGNQEFQAVLQKARPKKLYLFADHPSIYHLNDFLSELAGYVRYALNSYDGDLDIHALAVRTAQREILITKGVEWLEARGDIEIIRMAEKTIYLVKGDKKSSSRLEEIGVQLRNIFRESLLYRTFYTRMSIDAIGYFSQD